MHLGDDVHAVDDDRALARRAQRDVQHRAILRDVDPLPPEHGFDALVQPALTGELHQQPHRLVGDPVLGVVEKQPLGLGRQPLAAAGIVGKQLTQVHVAGAGVMPLQLAP